MVQSSNTRKGSPGQGRGSPKKLAPKAFDFSLKLPPCPEADKDHMGRLVREALAREVEEQRLATEEDQDGPPDGEEDEGSEKLPF